jgi:subtilisin-like proprotein convertase family protein
VDVDECAVAPAPCDPLTTCTNDAGGYSCGACPGGYEGDGDIGCTDVDECANGTHACAPGTACTNEPGGYQCGCPDGQVGDGFDCTNEVVVVRVELATPAAIADNVYDGTADSMTCVAITVPSFGGYDTVGGGMEVLVGMQHLWVGDLIYKLYSPGGLVLPIMSRPGFAEVADDGEDIFAVWGYGADLVTSHPIRYSDSGAWSAENVGSTLASFNATLAACRNDARCHYAPHSGAAPGVGTFAGFDGTEGDGDWTFCVADTQEDDTGSLSFVELRFRRVAD